jgi:antitoxin (DNA-binding transcriptional repressor) of toxin-antitoxin stability system
MMVVAGLVLAGLAPVSAQAPAIAQPPIAGTWKLNPEKSGTHVPPGYVEIRQYRLRSDGYLVGLLFTGDARGLRYLQFVAKSDGRDYPEYSDQIVADLVAAGTPTPRSYAETKLDDYTTAWIDKAGGKITGQGRKVVSQDGRTLTITVDGQPAVRVYDRQP